MPFLFPEEPDICNDQKEGVLMISGLQGGPGSFAARYEYEKAFAVPIDLNFDDFCLLSKTFS